MVALSAEFQAFLAAAEGDGGSTPQMRKGSPSAPTMETVPVIGTVAIGTVAIGTVAIGTVASAEAPHLRTLAELLHWCAPPVSVLRVLYPLAEAGQLEADALAYLRKWEAIRGPGPVPELDGGPVATSSPAHRGARSGR